jgi:hypothetical protein
MQRRTLVKGLAATPVVAAVAQRSGAAEQDQGEEMVDYLFVQNAQGVSLQDGVLTLQGVTRGQRPSHRCLRGLNASNQRRKICLMLPWETPRFLQLRGGGVVNTLFYLTRSMTDQYSNLLRSSSK